MHIFEPVSIVSVQVVDRRYSTLAVVEVVTVQGSNCMPCKRNGYDAAAGWLSGKESVYPGHCWLGLVSALLETQFDGVISESSATGIGLPAWQSSIAPLLSF